MCYNTNKKRKYSSYMELRISYDLYLISDYKKYLYIDFQSVFILRK